ncbi:MAG: response regulator [Bacteroidia bacterium]|nr:response regulator [Bacteroidia bacterium]
MLRLNSVLLVDDDEDDLFLHRKILERSKKVEYIFTARNGLDALKLLRGEKKPTENHGQFVRPDLIIIDLNMPVMNAWGFLELYPSLEEAQKAQAIILTSSVSLKSKLEEALLEKSPVSNFLTKPLDMAALERILVVHISALNNRV